MSRHRTLLAIMLGLIAPLAGCSGGVRDPRVDGHRSVIIGRGRTAAGEPFVAIVGLEHVPARRYRGRRFAAELEPRGGCSLPVFVREDHSKWSYEVCYARSEISQQVGIQCEAGKLVIHLAAPPETRAVRLTLSNGREVTSGVIFLPRRLGGPLALYYQSLHGPAPIPVAATELAADGHVLGRIPAYPMHECTETMVRTLPGSRALKVNAANGETVTIAIEHTRMLGKTYLGLRLVLSSGIITESAALRVAPALYWNVGRVCGSRPYAVVYGVLDDPHDKAFIRAGDRVEPLQAVAVPSRKRSRHVVVYKISTRSPERLVVRTSSGRVRAEESIASVYAETPCAR